MRNINSLGLPSQNYKAKQNKCDLPRTELSTQTILDPFIWLDTIKNEN